MSLPHSIMVAVEEMGLREGQPADQPLLDILCLHDR
jgi:GTP-binding protein Era